MRRGFTLLEILVTILIFSILVTVTGYVYASALARSRDQQRISDLQTISNGLEQFYLDHKSYPSLGTDGTELLFLAKFQLEPFDNCLSDHKYLVPTYIGSIPEDPQKKFALIGTPPNCDSQTTQAGQYLYVPVISSAGEVAKNFQLAAKVERPNNVSDYNPFVNNMIGFYRPLLESAGINFCTNTTNPNCTHNRFLGPKTNN